MKITKETLIAARVLSSGPDDTRVLVIDSETHPLTADQFKLLMVVGLFGAPGYGGASDLKLFRHEADLDDATWVAGKAAAIQAALK